MATMDEKQPLLPSYQAEEPLVVDAHEPVRRERRISPRLHILLSITIFMILYTTVQSLYEFLDLGNVLEDTFSPFIRPTPRRVLKRAPLIDGHNDWPIFFREFTKNRIYENFTTDTTLPGQVDFPRLREGGLGGQFWSVYTDCPKSETNLSTPIYDDAVRQSYEQIDLASRLINRFPSELKWTLDSNSILANFKRHPSTISSLLGAEGLHQIGNRPSNLRAFYSLGVRYMTLTHSCHNIYADSCGPGEPLHGGLSPRGRELVLEMNRLGMLVDISHVSHDTMRQVLDVSLAPVMFSHSSAYAVCQHPRNVPDDVLHTVKEKGGVVMVNFVPDFIHCKTSDPRNATIDDVLEHMMHIGNLIGWEHVGIGGDFDGTPYMPKGIEDVSKYPDLIQGLIDRGVKTRELKGVVGLNVLRVMKNAEKVAKKLQKEGRLPLEDDLSI